MVWVTVPGFILLTAASEARRKTYAFPLRIVRGCKHARNPADPAYSLLHPPCKHRAVKHFKLWLASLATAIIWTRHA